MRALLATIALLGCSIPDKHLITGDAKSDGPRPIDAPIGNADAGAPFACLGKPFPTTAPQTLTLTAHTVDASSSMSIANVNLSGFIVGSSTPLISVATDANGMITAMVPTGGQSIDGYLVATPQSGSGYMTSVLYPSRPFDEDRSIPVNLLTPTVMSQGATLANVTVDVTRAQMSIAVVDCNGSPLANATVATLDSSMTPTGTVRYVAGGLPSKTTTATDASGLAFVFNVNPGTVTVTAIVGGMTLHTHNVNAPVNEWTQAAIQP